VLYSMSHCLIDENRGKRFPFLFFNPHTNIHFGFLLVWYVYVVGTTKETKLDVYKWVQSNKSRCRLFFSAVGRKTQQSSCLAKSGKDSFSTTTDVPQHTKEINTQYKSLMTSSSAEENEIIQIFCIPELMSYTKHFYYLFIVKKIKKKS
jgi:hypothetical protein